MKNKKAENKQHAKSIAVAWTDHAWEDYFAWQKEDPKILDEINSLIEECLRNPFAGTGKPEPLKGDLTGFWSRRITREHRLVYMPEDKGIYVVSCRYHY
ncbi:toxin YoeB [Oxalobacteraceae bacterium GrIS 2.11]